MLTTNDKLARGHALKNEGNTAFQAGNAQEAMRKYHEALLHVSGLDRSLLPPDAQHPVDAATPEQLREADAVRVACFNNLSACQAKKENWPRAREYASKVLAIEPDNVKALFRRGQASLRMNDLDHAQRDLEAVAKADPDDGKVKAEMKMLSTRLQQMDLKQRQELRGFLTRDK